MEKFRHDLKARIHTNTNQRITYINIHIDKQKHMQAQTNINPKHTLKHRRTRTYTKRPLINSKSKNYFFK
jgi:hypothetical protein